jgi:hypothetical protein
MKLRCSTAPLEKTASQEGLVNHGSNETQKIF